MKGTNIREIRSWDGIVDADDGFAGSSSLRKACTNDAKETAAAESLKKKRCRSSRFSVNTDRSSYSIIRLGQSPQCTILLSTDICIMLCRCGSKLAVGVSRGNPSRVADSRSPIMMLLVCLCLSAMPSSLYAIHGLAHQ